MFDLTCLRFSKNACLRQLIDAVANDGLQMAFIPAFKSIRIKDNIDKLLKFEALKSKLAGDNTPYNVKVARLTQKETISRIGIIYSDVIAHPPLDTDDCYQDLLQYCSNNAPYLVIHKSEELYLEPFLLPSKVKEVGYITNGGSWISGDALDQEQELVNQLSIRWQKKAFAGPPPFTSVCGHPTQFESYHHKDSNNLHITVNTNANNTKVPLSFIRLGSYNTQALLR